MRARSATIYIGSFPPPHGGVTVKNDLLFRHLSKTLPLEKVDLTRVKALDPRTAAAFFRSLLSRDGALVLGMSKGWLARTALALHILNRGKMARSVVFVMGGAIPAQGDVQRLSRFKCIYVETEGMRRDFERAGMKNVAVYPNCREKPTRPVEFRGRQEGQPLRCVYFSQVSSVKGAGVVLSAAAELPEVDFSVYGQIVPGFEGEFLRGVRALPNVTYQGVFDSVEEDAIAELVQYDVHLFPTRWPNEGVPGVIVETKVAGVPTVATDYCHNAELIEDGTEGLLMRGDASDEELTKELVAGLRVLSDNPALLASMKSAALASAESYYMENHIDELVKMVRPQSDTGRKGA